MYAGKSKQATGLRVLIICRFGSADGAQNDRKLAACNHYAGSAEESKDYRGSIIFIGCIKKRLNEL